MNLQSERPDGDPSIWPLPPSPYQDIPTPHLESVNDAVVRCLQAAHEIRLWAESWPNRLNRPAGVTDHLCAIRDLMDALSIAEPLLDACRDEFARVNTENVTVAGEIDASLHAGAYWYSTQFAKVAAITIDSLLMISPPHPITGASEMDIIGLPELRPDAYASEAKKLPLVDYADLVASISRECARAQGARDASVPNFEPTHGMYVEQDANTRDAAFAGLFGIFANGVTDKKFERAVKIAGDKLKTVNDRLTEIDELFPFPSTVSANALANLLGRSKPAIIKSLWWQEHRAGKDKEKQREREIELRERAKQREKER